MTQRTEPRAASRTRSFLLVGTVVAALAFILVEAIRWAESAWRVDFSNSAWGPIAAAFVSGIVGVALKAILDTQIARTQIKIQSEMQENLAQIKGEVDDRNSANAARRDYEYEARKHLYDEVEPLLFQVYEALEEAHHRVRSLARTARNDELIWLESNGYYLSSTVYKMLLPAAYLRLIQRRMTFVDLGLDPRIELRYLLLKRYVRSFTDDFDFAQLSPELPYDPNHADWAVRCKKQPAVYARQALVVGDVECVGDLMVVKEGEKSRAMSFGEFDSLVRKKPMDESLQEAFDLFRGFTPKRKPVLARLLVAQACLSNLILSTYRTDSDRKSLEERYRACVDDEMLTQELDWGEGEEDGVSIAAGYWATRLSWVRKELASRQPAVLVVQTPARPSAVAA